MIIVQKNTKEECNQLFGVKRNGKFIKWRLGSFMALNIISAGRMNILVFVQRMNRTGYSKWTEKTDKDVKKSERK